MATVAKTFLQLLVTGIYLVPTDATEDPWDPKIFTEHFDPSGLKWKLHGRSESTEEIFAEVYEVVEGETFTNIREGLHVGNLKQLLFPRVKITQFARDYRHRLHPDGERGTYFLFTDSDKEPNETFSNVFIADVFADKGIGVNFFKFTDDFLLHVASKATWVAGDRIVLPIW